MSSIRLDLPELRAARLPVSEGWARSNDFQAVVYFVRSHVDAHATVTESALLPDRTGAGPREVDVLITSRVQGREFRIGVECRDHRRANGIELVTPERPIPIDGPLGRPGRPRLEFREVIRDRLISVSGHVHRDGRLQRIPLAAGGAVFNAEGAQITSIAQIVADILDKADLRQAVADASGQAGELRAEVDELVLRSADGGEPVRARSPTCTSP